MYMMIMRQCWKKNQGDISGVWAAFEVHKHGGDTECRHLASGKLGRAEWMSFLPCF